MRNYINEPAAADTIAENEPPVATAVDLAVISEDVRVIEIVDNTRPSGCLSGIISCFRLSCCAREPQIQEATELENDLDTSFYGGRIRNESYVIGIPVIPPRISRSRIYR